MPHTKIVFYLEEDGTVPIVEWLCVLQPKARAKCQAYLARLQSEGHDLRRPVADYLRDGIHELRPSFRGVQYRVLYFFHGQSAVVISHGLVKEQKVPAGEIERALNRLRRFKSDPQRFTFVPRKGE